MVGGALHAATKPWRTPTAFPSKNENSRLEKGELRSRSPSPPSAQVLAPKNQQNFWKIFDDICTVYIYINLYLPLLLCSGGRQSNLWAWKWFCPFLPVVTIEFDRMRLSTWRSKGQEKGRSTTETTETACKAVSTLKHVGTSNHISSKSWFPRVWGKKRACFDLVRKNTKTTNSLSLLMPCSHFIPKVQHDRSKGV